MKGLVSHRSFLGKHTARAALSLVVATTAGGAMGCLNRPIDTIEPRITATIVEKITQSSVDKIDILLAIDNSRSMADKQNILALAVPDLVKGLLNPKCVDANGVPAQMQPAGPSGMGNECPAGTTREFTPVVDVHIGVISSSIGGHGADSCPNSDPNSKECSPNPNTTNNDKAHLVSRLGQCGGQEVPTYQNQGFLAWDPDSKLSPPGENSIPNASNALRDMVVGTGQIGCGYESQLESIYRFLADPKPYESIAVTGGKATPTGEDTILTAQRAQFMRPDSLLAVIMLTDENDCSIKEYGQFYYVGQLRNGATNVRMPRARKICETDPNDPCCKSCGQADGSCPADPTCANPNGGPALLTAEEDDINLRCWDQKRRFGIDFLYPTDRYVDAFRKAEISDNAGNVLPNPIFSDLLDQKRPIRDPGLVFFAGIVGVPWQDIARDPTDLKKGFKDAKELAQTNPNGLTSWDIILGDPSKNVKPADPLMIESIQARTGTNPVTNEPLVNAGSPTQNPINGHEWTIDNDDLQYACIFPLLPGEERDCTNSNLTACDCFATTNDNPLCQPDPANNNAPTKQTKAKGYPGLRELSVLKNLGSQGIVASVCPAQLTDQSDTGYDFGYRPAIGAIIERLKTVLGGQCLPRTLVEDEKTGNFPCLILEARNTQGGACVCGDARTSIAPGSDAEKAVNVAKQDPAAKDAGWDCFCEINQLKDKEGDACQSDVNNPPLLNGAPVNGWCYVDPDLAVNSDPGSPNHNPDIVSKCPDNEKRIIRFVGTGAAQTGATLLITCSGDSGS